MTTATIDSRSPAVPATRRSQLICCVLCMVLIANLQYGWTLFVNPISQAHGWSIASIQVAFSIFIALETWLTPIHGWIVDGLGGRVAPSWSWRLEASDTWKVRTTAATEGKWSLSLGIDMKPGERIDMAAPILIE